MRSTEVPATGGSRARPLPGYSGLWGRWKGQWWWSDWAVHPGCGAVHKNGHFLILFLFFCPLWSTFSWVFLTFVSSFCFFPNSRMRHLTKHFRPSWSSWLDKLWTGQLISLNLLNQRVKSSYFPCATIKGVDLVSVANTKTSQKIKQTSYHKKLPIILVKFLVLSLILLCIII